MSRVPIRTYLASAKTHLRQILQESKGSNVSKHGSRITHLVIGNESADLDSITSALVSGYLMSTLATPQGSQDTSSTLLIPVTNIPAADLPLRPELTALLRHADLKPSDLITLDDLGADFPPAEMQTQWTLVDHNVFQGDLGRRCASAVTGVIDHHDDEHAVPDSATPRVIEQAGSCSSLVVEFFQGAWERLSSAASSAVGAASGQADAGAIVDDAAYTSTWDAQVAKLALGSILVDTINMTAEAKVTEHDRDAVRFLEAKIFASSQIGKDFSRDAFFNEINDAKSNIDDLSLVDILRKDYKQWADAEMELGVASVVQNIEYLHGKEEGDFIAACRKFAQERSLDLFAVMTAYNDKTTGKFARELLLISLKGGKAQEAAGRFASNAEEELQLHDEQVGYDGDDLPFVRLWDQRNLDASRKRVAPLLRESMRNGNAAGKL